MHGNINNMSPEEITKYQNYLQEIKLTKLQQKTDNITTRARCSKDRYKNSWNLFNRMDENIKLHQHPSDITKQEMSNFPQLTRHSSDLNFYNNPYEYGSLQYGFGDLSRDPYLGPYSLQGSSLEQMGLDPEQYYHKTPNGIRNVDVETGLSRLEMARRPKQSGLSQIEVNRFELLPHDPQDHRHIVWEDNLPRGGVSTRNERLEYQ
jgi:hypothetical protein